MLESGPNSCFCTSPRNMLCIPRESLFNCVNDKFFHTKMLIIFPMYYNPYAYGSNGV